MLMRSTQWNVLGMVSLLLTFWFSWLYNVSSEMCRIPDIFLPLNRLDIINCVRSEVVGVIGWIFSPLAVAFFICGLIEKHPSKK